jgi:hypothetical protein
MRAAPGRAGPAPRVIARKFWRVAVTFALMVALMVAEQGEFRVNLM